MIIAIVMLVLFGLWWFLAIVQWSYTEIHDDDRYRGPARSASGLAPSRGTRAVRSATPSGGRRTAEGYGARWPAHAVSDRTTSRRSRGARPPSFDRRPLAGEQ